VEAALVDLTAALRLALFQRLAEQVVLVANKRLQTLL
jgi:hypothetical protein